MSCVGNDFGFEFVFSRYLEAFAKEGDILLAISTSGTSKNILNGIKVAKDKGCRVIGLTGKANTPVATGADIAIITPGFSNYADKSSGTSHKSYPYSHRIM